jgi:hypothetical protein
MGSSRFAGLHLGCDTSIQDCMASFSSLGFRSSQNPDAITAVAGDRSKLVPYPPEQLILSKMLELRRLGFGPREIARTLNEASILHP